MKKIMSLAAAVIFSASVFAATGSKVVTLAPQTTKTAHKKEVKKTTKKTTKKEATHKKGTMHKKSAKKAKTAKKAK
ncbi:MAG TPA: histone [Bacteroidia bacterium]|nr:histone [Bacteroidia bacterium]